MRSQNEWSKPRRLYRWYLEPVRKHGLCFFQVGAAVFLNGVFCRKNTNVIELYNLLLKEVGENAGQRTWYNSGIGTYARPSWKSLNYYKQALYHKIDLEIAWCVQSPDSKSCPNLLLVIQRFWTNGFGWLSDNYKTGDCIFLFGSLKSCIRFISPI